MMAEWQLTATWDSGRGSLMTRGSAQYLGELARAEKAMLQKQGIYDWKHRIAKVQSFQDS